MQPLWLGTVACLSLSSSQKKLGALFLTLLVLELQVESMPVTDIRHRERLCCGREQIDWMELLGFHEQVLIREIS